KQGEPYVYHAPPEGLQDPEYRDNFPRMSPDFASGVVSDWKMQMRFHIDHGDLVVPEKSYFAMGDSRENMWDSRHWGFVPEENLIGRPLFIYWSFDTPESQYNRTFWPERIKFIFHVVVHFFDQTRWSRMFHPVR